MTYSKLLQIDNNHSFLSELESSFSSYRNSSYLHNGSTSEDTYYNPYMYDTQYSWNNHINSCIDKSLTNGEREGSDIQTLAKGTGDLTIESSDDIDVNRIKLSIDPGTWHPMDEDMVSLDPIEFHSEEEPYKDRIDSYQRKTGLTEAIQTGIGQLNGIPIAVGVMDFQFMGGSVGSVVGKKITLCASGGGAHARRKFELDANG
ncbi:hypothetical protein M9H77_18022 [Catharanthus roseus]|uniref:Uncharacterized protein n=1 Tax=Catharanthus roseus TaxID=4058 RepID=A0ACC0B6B9_CATRO|nr:hypothetical protein M9H77_18022 [Catharanthus roseus]